MPVKTVKLKGSYDTDLMQHNNLFTTANKEFALERVDLNADKNSKIIFFKRLLVGISFPKHVTFPYLQLHQISSPFVIHEVQKISLEDNISVNGMLWIQTFLYSEKEAQLFTK